MHRLLIALILLFFVSSNAEVYAQNNWEVGLRLADNIAIDATVPIAQAPRLHMAVYLDRFGVAAYGDWVFNLSGAPKNLKLYVGAGPEIFFEHRFDLAASGEAGVEWVFDEVPVTIGIDWRPAFRLTHGTDFLTGNWGFVARFRLASAEFTPAK